jgi:hypothetical protein
MRKHLLAGALGLALLAGCTMGPNGPVVTLAGAQAEAAAILTALEAGAAIYTTAPTTSSSQAAAVEKILAIAQEAVGNFQGGGPTQTPAQLAQTVSQDIVAVLAVLPIDPVTKTAIDAGLAVIDALVAGFSAAPGAPAAPTPAPTPKFGLAMPHGIPGHAAPVPIPLPTRLPPRVGAE